MRPLLPLLILASLFCAACGGDGQPGEPPAAVPFFPLECRFVNVDDENLIAVGIQGELRIPETAEPTTLFENWQRPEVGDELVLAYPDSIPAGSVVQAWFLVLAYWGEHEPNPRWRAWATRADVVRRATDAKLAFRWPEDRFALMEVTWPPLGTSPLAEAAR